MKASELARQILAQIALHGDMEIGRYNAEFGSSDGIAGVYPHTADPRTGAMEDDDVTLGDRFFVIE